MCFLIKFFDDDKKNLISMIDFLCQIEILLLNMLKLFKVPGFFQILSNSVFFLPKLSILKSFVVK